MKLVFAAFFLLLFLGSCDAPRHPSPREALINELPADKVWAHRVNVIRGNEDRIRNFSGIEIDIFHDLESGFRVKHDEEEEGIDLEMFLDSLEEIRDTRIWIDFKNFGSNPGAGAQLANLLVSRGLKDSSFVESYDGFALQGFPPAINTCFWIGNDLVDPEINQDIALERIRSKDVNMYSGEYLLFDSLEKHFPDRFKNYWIHGELDNTKLGELKRICASERTNIVLIDALENPLSE